MSCLERKARGGNGSCRRLSLDTRPLMNSSVFFPQTVYCWGSQCCLKCVRLDWDAVSASLVSSSSCLRSCLPTCLPSWLGRCVRFPGLVFLLSLVLSPNLSPVKNAVSASLVSSCSCLPTCLPSGHSNLSPVWDAVSRLPGLVLLLSPVLSPSVSFCPSPWSRLSLVFGLVSQLVSGLGCCVRLPGLVLLLSPVWRCSCLWSGMLCPPP